MRPKRADMEYNGRKRRGARRTGNGRGGTGVTDHEAMGEALREAEKALEEGELPVGCAVVYGGRVIARAHNERERANDPTAHAEVLALRRAGSALGNWRLDGCTLYVTLEPCCMCAGAAAQSRLAAVVYGAPDPEKGCCGSVYRIAEDADLGNKCPCRGGVREEECRALLERFFAEARGKGKTQVLPDRQDKRRDRGV